MDYHALVMVSLIPLLVILVKEFHIPVLRISSPELLVVLIGNTELLKILQERGFNIGVRAFANL